MMTFEAQIDGDTFRVDDVSTQEALELFAVWQLARRPLPPVVAGEAVSLRLSPFQLGEEGIFMLSLSPTQKCGLSLNPVDASEHPATLDGVPVWSSTDDSVVVVEPAPDGLTAVARAQGKLGSAKVEVKADARMGPEVSELTDSLDIEVAAGEAKSLGLTAGTPEEQAVVNPV